MPNDGKAADRAAHELRVSQASTILATAQAIYDRLATELTGVLSDFRQLRHVVSSEPMKEAVIARNIFGMNNA